MEDERCPYCRRVVGAEHASKCGPQGQDQPCPCCGLVLVAEQPTPKVEEVTDEQD